MWGPPVVGGGVLHDNDNDDTHITPLGRFDLQSRSAEESLNDVIMFQCKPRCVQDGASTPTTMLDESSLFFQAEIHGTKRLRPETKKLVLQTPNALAGAPQHLWQFFLSSLRLSKLHVLRTHKGSSFLSGIYCQRYDRLSQPGYLHCNVWSTNVSTS